ncbi:hypothetical protein N9I98_00360 [Flavobacteriales bacterium]|jgi:hypothetical protein|nr:hypothetical protein [Flavobacteriales bacterium]
MNDLLYTIGDLFEATFELLIKAGNMPNLLLSLLGVSILAFCMKLVTTEKNILEK